MKMAAGKTKKKRVAVIGLDGATWDLIDPWIKEGKLPFLKSLKERGAYGILKSTIPPLTPPAWTSIFTGVNPGKHAIFDFFEMDGYKKYPVLSTDRKVDAVWEVASGKGKRVYVIGVPLTFPPDEVRGVMVSGLGSPGPDSDFVHPLSSKSKVLEILGGEDLFLKDIPLLFAKDRENFLKRVHELMERQKELSLHLLKKGNWDLFVSVFMGIDWIGHFFWKDMDKNHPGYDPEKSKGFEDAIEKVYVKMDQILAEIYEEVKKDSYFVILSDHGFGPVHKDIYINALLREKGYLSADLPSSGSPRFGSKLRRFVLRLIRVVDRFGLRRRIPLKHRATIRKSVGLEKREFLDYINWGKTKAFSLSSSGQGIRINFRRRYPQGAVEEKDFEKIAGEIRVLLRDLRDPETGEKVIKETYLARDVYRGPYVSEGPDILVETKGEYILNAEISEEVFGSARHAGVQRSGEHRERGIFLVDGGETKGEVGEVETFDIAPTILNVLGITPSTDLDGRVLKI